MQRAKKYISLKEAASISGYAPDYVGQLIRKGKLEGKWVYCNVAWMTTENAIRSYSAENKRKKNPNSSLKETTSEKMRRLKLGLMSETKMAGLAKLGLYATAGASLLLSLVMFHFLSLSIERKLQREERGVLPEKTKATILQNVQL